MREPTFWSRPAGSSALLLAPAAALYGAIAARRMARPGHRAPIPVICVGNFTLGGTGKTPTAVAIARILSRYGHRPFFLTRGYGGHLAGPVRVEPQTHTARDVGDEALLLARVAPTIVARDRAAGADTAARTGASVVVMDDGFQNPSLAKDLALIVLDGRRGIGNGRVNPAGPLRAPLGAQLDRAHALIVVGEAEAAAQTVIAAARERGLPVFPARLEPDAGTVATLRGRPHLAFAGIGDPAKFFASLAQAGITAPVTAAFPDHHRYTGAEAKALCARAERDGLGLVTTEKDLARLAGHRETADLAARARALPVALVFSNQAAISDLLLRTGASGKSD